MKHTQRILRVFSFLCLGVAANLHAQSVTDDEPQALIQSAAPNTSATISGAVLDPSGAAIPHAAIHLLTPGNDRNATSDAAGRFSLALPAGTYQLVVEAPGFRIYTRPSLVIGAHNAALNITLEIATDTEEVNVGDDNGLSTDAASSKSGLTLKGDQLDTLSDDPVVMQQQLTALTGSIDPTQPPQLYIDGFSGGTMPPKESIREIRVNQNPFSSQYDQFGSGRIEIFTKPGTNKLHGDINFVYGNSAFNSLNPYTGAQPAYSADFRARQSQRSARQT